MLKGFKDFIMRGNLVELAVAFVMGLAFAAVVTSLVDNIIMPLVGKIFGKPDFSSIQPGDIPVGSFINDVVAFVFIAAGVYFLVVLPYNKFNERFRKGEEMDATPADIALLTEIRDLLSRGQAATPPGGGSHSA